MWIFVYLFIFLLNKYKMLVEKHFVVNLKLLEFTELPF